MKTAQSWLIKCGSNLSNWNAQSFAKIFCVCAGLIKSITHAKMGISPRFGKMFLISDPYLLPSFAATPHKGIFKREE